MSTELSLKVHRIRFFVAELSSINCMAFNESMNKLAIIRRRIRKYKSGQSDTLSTIEIWNFRSKAPFVEQIIDDNSDNPSLLESLVWTPNGRLFSCGLNSYLNEYDLNNSRIKRSYSVRSGPVWTMALDSTNTLIALGTEESYICVFRIEDQMLNFDKVMDRNDSRILSLQWHRPNDNTSQLIISGSIDYIKIWNYQTGRCIDYIKVGNTGIVIWCLAVLEDFTIISGDSSVLIAISQLSIVQELIPLLFSSLKLLINTILGLIQRQDDCIHTM
jgi:U3 small nucleolar RNA-associated protein 4